jgi:predicted PurR-regulated permease PerM
MEYILVFGIMFIVVALISWRWVEGIDYMHKNHPDYKGNDLFGDFEDGAPWENNESKDINDSTEEVM